MPDRIFEVVSACAGQQPGAEVPEGQLTGCNVDALVAGGFLVEVIPSVAPQPVPPPDSPPEE